MSTLLIVLLIVVLLGGGGGYYGYNRYGTGGLGGVLGFAQAITLGLFKNTLITLDQVRQLRQDNVVAPGAKTLADLGIEPTNLGSVIPEYLWRYRVAGQFAAIRDSAKNLPKV